MSLDHDLIHKVVTSQGGYGKGVVPNPYAKDCKEWVRRVQHAYTLKKIQDKIVSLMEPRFITPPETSEAIAALVTLTDSRSILELGCCTGFTTYHMLKAVYGKQGARIVTIDATPNHDAGFFSEFPIITFVKGWTPECLVGLPGPFDFVFVDSSHELSHTKKEVDELMLLTKKGSVIVFHDVPEWQRPDVPEPSLVREWLLADSRLRGLCLPTGEQADCLATWGEGYPKQCNPGLGVFVRL